MSRAERRGGGLSALRRLMIMAISGLLTLALVAALGGIWALWTYQGPGPAAKHGPVHVVMLRRGAGLNEIASSLEKAGVVGSAPVFLAAAQITGAARELKAGEYEFPSRAPMSLVLDYIRKGKVVRHQVTIPEGWTSEMVVEALMKEQALTGEVATPAEGTILPETYDYERGEERAAVLQRMMDDRDQLLASLWDKRKSGLPIRTPEEAVTLASIVEKETGVASERPRVAAVFMNRLNQGIRLQSDPTIIYGLNKGRPLGRGIRRSELDAPNPYNTYQIDGLPPGPIANPGRASLAAVLDPPDTNEIYFVADGSGGHAFASTLEEHARNVEHWRAIEQQKAAAKAAAKGN
ncbi:MAG: aminodeoxychorismate lyase [Caulobacter sp.]|nr:aminodeoxychorismate lyase [Caulobacter sp.]